MDVMCTSSVCEGNFDDDYLRLPNIHDGEFKDPSRKLFKCATYNELCK